MTLFGNTLTWDEAFDRDELLDAAGKFLSKVVDIIVKWFKENVEPFAVKFFQVAWRMILSKEFGEND